MNVFEVAALNKYRFETNGGVLTVEDLFDLPIKSERGRLDLYSIASGLAEGMGKNDNEMLAGIFSEEVKVNTEAKTKFDIVQRVVEMKRAENKARLDKVNNKAEKEKLLEALARKKDQAIDQLSQEDLEAKLAALG